jgi:hypothetical protein
MGELGKIVDVALTLLPFIQNSEFKIHHFLIHFASGGAETRAGSGMGFRGPPPFQYQAFQK